MQKRVFILLALIMASITSGFSSKPSEVIQWISFEQAAKQFATNPKPILIDIYTDWCGWCKKMDVSTYRSQQLVKYVKEKFYAIKFNAESKNPIVFSGKKFVFDEKRDVHQLAVYLTGGNLSFPHTVFLSGITAQPAPLAGYLKPSEIEGPLKYFGEKANELSSYAEFTKGFKGTFRK